MIKVLTPGYFARKDTRTPVKIAIFAVGVNVTLNLILIWPLAHVGLALATAISAWLNAALLARGLRRRGYLRLDERLRRRLPRIVFASAVMAVGLAGGVFGLDAVGEQEGGMQVLGLAVLIVGGGLLFAAVAHLTGATRLSDIRGLLRSKAPSD
jgi:putative peptidoglycan lipid II flippase